MADLFLLPEDVSAENAQQVLDFINTAASAQVIAEAVEFPNELDVGVRIAQRIINRRTELNGFGTLDQLYAVPYIGPERFTEIVVSLSGARPPRAVVTGVTPSELADLRRSVDALRSMLQPAAQARVWSVQETIWIGQGANVLVQVNDGSGRSLADQPVTITTSWGELVAVNGVETISGNTVVSRTNDVGLVELRLRLRFQAPLSDAQRLALELAAGRLPLTAPWPTAASAELSDLVQRYRAHGSDDLREAVDAAFREYALSVEQAEHRGQALAQWAQIPVNLVCFVNDDGDDRGQRHLALATHTLMVRNWLPAFLATFENDVAADGALASELQRAPKGGADATVFLNDVFVSVQSFMNTERGALGQTIRNRAAQKDLQQVLQNNVASLAPEAQLDALGGVRNASTTIGKGGLTLFTAVDTTRRDSKTRLDLTADVFTNRLGALERVAVTTPQLDDFRTQILQQTRNDLTTGLFNAQATLDTQFRGLVVDAQAQLSQKIDLKADRTAVDTLATSTLTLRQDLDLKADRTTVDALAASSATLRRDVDAKADRATVDALATSNVTLRRDLDGLSASTATLRTDVSGLSTSVNGLSTSVNGLNTRVNTGLTTLGTRVDVIDARVRRGPP